MNTQDYYANNANAYIAESMTFDMTKFNNFTDQIIKDKELKTILDLGFGSARDMLYFASQGLNVTGIDSCDEFVSQAKDKGLDVYKENLPYVRKFSKGKFDLIYSVGLIFHLTKEERVLLFNNFIPMLNTGGVLILSYNTLDRTSDKDRFFDLLTKEMVDEEVNMKIISEEVMRDKRGFDWITVAYSL